MRRFLSLVLALIVWAGPRVLAEGTGFSRSVLRLTWTGAESVVVTGDQDQFSDPVALPTGLFNAASVALAITGASPDLTPRLQLLSPVDGTTYTELFEDPILTPDDGALTATGHYVFVIQLPIVTKIRIRLDGNVGCTATVRGVLIIQ